MSALAQRIMRAATHGDSASTITLTRDDVQLVSRVISQARNTLRKLNGMAYQDMSEALAAIDDRRDFVGDGIDVDADGFDLSERDHDPDEDRTP